MSERMMIIEAHGRHCQEMALIQIVENNDATRVLEGERELTPETPDEALEWLANGNATCHCGR